jgi:alanyl-tRNA synthetase
MLLIVGEASIGTGLRRIEAVTGRGSESYIYEKLAILEEAARELKSMPSELSSKIKAMAHSLSVSNKTVASLQMEVAKGEIDRTINNSLQEVKGINVLSAHVASMPMPAMMQLGDLMRDKLKSAVIVLATVYEDKPYFIATITPDLIARGLHSGKLIKKVAEAAGGSGGGKAEMAQAGARDKNNIDKALSITPKYIDENLKS